VIGFVDFISRKLAEGSGVSEALRMWAVGDSDFVESEHPRNEEGEFTEKGGSKRKNKKIAKKKESQEHVIPKLKSYESQGLKYGQDLPENVYLHGSESEEDIDPENMNQATLGGTFFLSRSWETANRYSKENQNGIKAVKLNPEHLIDLSKEEDRIKLATIIIENVPGYEGMDIENFANGSNGLEKNDLDETSMIETEGASLFNTLYENGIWGIVDATNRRNVEVLSNEIFEPIEKDISDESIQEVSASRGKSLHKEQIGTVDFMGDTIKVSTVNGQYTRSPYGPDIIEFTMGGNWYGGSREGTYRPICAEDEVVLHELMPPVDILATLVHEVIERWGMKTKGLSYDDAHSELAEPAERKARRILEGGDWSFEGSLGEQFQRLIDRIAA
jgi:hypothetical protein